MGKRTVYHRCRKRGVRLGLRGDKLSEYVEKCTAREKYLETLQKINIGLLAKEKKPHRVIYVNVTPKEDPLTPILEDFFRNPSEIEPSKKERLDEFMKEPRDLKDIMEFLENED